MIVSDSDSIMGKATAIQTTNFICKVNTVKKGFLVGGLVTMIYDLSPYGTWNRMIEKNDMIALIKYSENANKEARLIAHGAICQMLSEWGCKGMQLEDIVRQVCDLLGERGIISDFNYRK